MSLLQCVFPGNISSQVENFTEGFFHKGSKHRNHDAEIMRLRIPNSALFILLSIFVKGMLTNQVSLTLNDSADLVCYPVSVVFASAPYV